MPRRNILITEFTVRVFADGRVDWGDADEFLWWILHKKIRGELNALTGKVSCFGVRRAARRRPGPANKKR